jgi:hypothetical protein
MHLLRFLTATVLAVAIPYAAIAQPHRIAQLGSAPLIGEISSTAQLKSDAVHNQAVFKAAGLELGLTPNEYAAFSSRVAAGRLAYVTVPRHLDAMSWASAGRVYVERDVVIPRATKGWEIDLQERNETVALFIPARCGNLSIVRRSRPRLAAAPSRIIADPTPAIAMSPTPLVTPNAMPAIAAIAQTSQAPQTHHSSWWPLLLIPLGFFFHGHGNVGPASTGGVQSFPTPAPAGCATPAAH